MAKVKVSTEVKAPVERVFELFTDIEHAAERVSGIKKIEVMSTGPFKLGYRWTETREVMGRLDSATMEISSIDTTFTFEPIPAGTEVSIEFELHPEGLPPALLLPLEWAIGGKVRHVLSDDLDDLKASIEKITGSQARAHAGARTSNVTRAARRPGQRAQARRARIGPRLLLKGADTASHNFAPPTRWESPWIRLMTKRSGWRTPTITRTSHERTPTGSILRSTTSVLW